MRVKQTQFTSGAYYHLYNHASKGELLFQDDNDYKKCLDLMRTLISSEYYDLKAYCFMPNHYHLLIKQKGEYAVNLPFFQIWQRYSRYYNEKYNQKGTIFRQKLQHIWIKDEKYLLNLVVYIHLNPVVAGLVESAADWKWSDVKSWLSFNKDSAVAEEIGFPDLITPEGYRAILTEKYYAKVGNQYLIDQTE